MVIYKMTEWTSLVKKTFHEGRRSNKNYSFKQALKDAKKHYHKKGGSDMAMTRTLAGGKRRRSRGRRTRRRSRRHR